MEIAPLAHIAQNAQVEPVQLQRGESACNADKLLAVVVKDFIKPAQDSSLSSAVETILQSQYETASHIIENMVLSPEERKAVEERIARIKNLKLQVKERKIEEDEALRLLDMILSAEDKKLAEKQLVEQQLFA